MKLIEWFRSSLGLMLLDWALLLLPKSTSAWSGAVRGLREQREYDRYWAWCTLLGSAPFAFERWRELRETMRVKVASSHRQSQRRRPARIVAIGGAR